MQDFLATLALAKPFVEPAVNAAFALICGGQAAQAKRRAEPHTALVSFALLYLALVVIGLTR
jgi:hypothetical protein